MKSYSLKDVDKYKCDWLEERERFEARTFCCLFQMENMYIVKRIVAAMWLC